jgi:uncharacterized YkwD family protein/spore coat assembly protein SafA
MKKRIILTLLFVLILSTNTFAQSLQHTVVPGDTLWKIAVKYQIGLSEIISANPQIKDPNLIYPGQKITVPNIDEIKALENEVIRLVNSERAKKGLPALKANWQVSRVARYKSQDMIDRNYFSHTSPTYGSPFRMLESFGISFSAAGENIAMGLRTPSEVMRAWMESPGHWANILNPSYNEIGVGLAKSSRGVCYWTQMFIKR